MLQLQTVGDIFGHAVRMTAIDLPIAALHYDGITALTTVRGKLMKTALGCVA